MNSAGFVDQRDQCALRMCPSFCEPLLWTCRSRVRCKAGSGVLFDPTEVRMRSSYRDPFIKAVSEGSGLLGRPTDWNTFCTGLTGLNPRTPAWFLLIPTAGGGSAAVLGVSQGTQTWNEGIKPNGRQGQVDPQGRTLLHPPHTPPALQLSRLGDQSWILFCSVNGLDAHGLVLQGTVVAQWGPVLGPLEAFPTLRARGGGRKTGERAPSAQQSHEWGLVQ